MEVADAERHGPALPRRDSSPLAPVRLLPVVGRRFAVMALAALPAVHPEVHRGGTWRVFGEYLLVDLDTEAGCR